MKRLRYILTVCLLSIVAFANAIDLSSVVITNTNNSLVSHNAGIGLLLPDDYQTVIFDGSGNPTMDKLFFLMTMPSGMASLTIGSTTLTASEDYLLSYQRSGSQYVMDMEPIDPTAGALQPMNVEQMYTQLSGTDSRLKVYMAGHISGKVKAELPETVNLINVPAYAEPYKQDIINAIIAKLHTDIESAENFDVDGFSFNQSTEGFFYFTGDGTHKLDLYLDNFSIAVQDKQIDFLGMMLAPLMSFNLAGLETPSGTAEEAKEVVIPKILTLIADKTDVDGLLGSTALGFEFISSMFSSLVQGTASPLAFSSNSESTLTPFHINIHTRGETTITGGAKGEFKNTSKEMEYVVVEGLKQSSDSKLTRELRDLSTIFQKMVNFTSAPLAVRPSSKVVGLGEADNYKYTVTCFTFDDEVPINGTTTHTNGLLCLPVVGDDLDAPSIDIGTPNGQVVFNSGRYKFHTPVSNKIKNMFYVASMSICYRELFMTMPAVGKITYAGIGSSVGTGPSGGKDDTYTNVRINDGTFETYSARAWADASRLANAVDGVANGWYKTYTDWRLPYQTSIFGGSFTNCDIYRCDAAAEQGVSPIYVHGSGTEKDTIFLCERTPVAAGTLCTGGTLSLRTNGTLNTTAATKNYEIRAGSGKNWAYNINYLTPKTNLTNNNDSVWLYIPSTCGKENKNYVTNYNTAMVPLGEYHMGTNMMSMGGDIEIKANYKGRSDLPMTNAFLLYLQLGYYTRKYAGIEMGGVKRTVQEEMQVEPEKHKNYTSDSDRSGLIFSEVTNPNPYRIEYGVYMMRPIVSDKWIMFSPPFDVANVYVLETTTDRTPKSSEAQWETHFQQQGEADGNMAQALVTSVLPDIFSGKGSGVFKPLPYILNNMTNAQTHLIKLKHWDGDFANLNSANYYLKQMKADVAEKNEWEQKNYQGAYGYKWEYAPASVAPTFIKQCIANCDDIVDMEEGEYKYHDEEGNERPAAEQRVVMKKGQIYTMFFPGGTNRFWDHKYLLFEGYGPQVIDGESVHKNQPQYDNDDNVIGTLNTITYCSPDGTIAPDQDYIYLQGNATFANDTLLNVSETTIYYDTYDNDIEQYVFEGKNTPDQLVLPSFVYMMSHDGNAIKSSMPTLSPTTTGIDELLAPTIDQQLLSLSAWTDNGIYIEAYEDQHLSVFTTDGREIWSGMVTAGQKTFIPVPTGIYIIRGEKNTIKVVN